MRWMYWAMLAYMVGAAGACASVRERASRFVGTLGCVAGCGLALYGASLSLTHRTSGTGIIGWSLPFGSLNLGVDSLAALWLMPVLIVLAMVAISGYRQPPGEYAANRPREHGLFLNLASAAIALSFLAKNGVFLLFALGVLLMAAFFLARGNGLALPAADSGVAGLTAGYLGWCVLFAALFVGAQGSESLNFHAANFGNASSPWFWLPLWAGFGALAGLFPFGRRYADRFAAAPASASAVMGGAVPALAFYWLARMALLADAPPPLWWGALLAASGAVTALAAGGFALGERDLSRLIAHSARKNTGLTAVCAGLAVLGHGDGRLSTADFSVAALLMANHVMSGALLWLCAANVRHASGTRNLERMGGLFRVIPATGGLFVLGAAWASLLPPFGGFSAATRIYSAVVRRITDSTSMAEVFLFSLLGAAIAAAGALGALALGRALGAAFFGTPRTRSSYPAKKEPPSRLVAPLGLAFAGVFLVYAARTAFPALTRAMLVVFALFAALLAGWWIAFGRRGAPPEAATGRGGKKTGGAGSGKTGRGPKPAGGVPVDSREHGAEPSGPDSVRPGLFERGSAWAEGLGLSRPAAGVAFFVLVALAVWLWTK